MNWQISCSEAKLRSELPEGQIHQSLDQSSREWIKTSWEWWLWMILPILVKFSLLIEFLKKLWVMQILSETHSANEGAFAFYISEEWFKLAKF